MNASSLMAYYEKGPGTCVISDNTRSKRDKTRELFQGSQLKVQQIKEETEVRFTGQTSAPDC